MKIRTSAKGSQENKTSSQRIDPTVLLRVKLGVNFLGSAVTIEFF